MGPEEAVLPAPAVGQVLAPSHRGEQLGVEEFVSEPAVERHGKAALPSGSWLNAGGGGTAGAI